MYNVRVNRRSPIESNLDTLLSHMPIFLCIIMIIHVRVHTCVHVHRRYMHVHLVCPTPRLALLKNGVPDGMHPAAILTSVAAPPTGTGSW